MSRNERDRSLSVEISKLTIYLEHWPTGEETESNDGDRVDGMDSHGRSLDISRCLESQSFAEILREDRHLQCPGRVPLFRRHSIHRL